MLWLTVVPQKRCKAIEPRILIRVSREVGVLQQDESRLVVYHPDDGSQRLPVSIAPLWQCNRLRGMVSLSDCQIQGGAGIFHLSLRVVLLCWLVREFEQAVMVET